MMVLLLGIFYQFMKDKEIFWVDDERKHMLQKGWSRPVTHSSFFLDEKLEWMDENKIDHAVVLNLSQLYGNGLRLEEMKKALRFQNDFNAKVQLDNASKFTCGFVVHPGFIQGALWEIRHNGFIVFNDKANSGYLNGLANAFLV